MEMGVADSIGVKVITTAQLDSALNEWLQMNADLEIIDIKYTWGQLLSAMIIYRKEM